MEPTARPRTGRDARSRSLAEAVKPLCETSLPGMARYVRMRLRYHGYPSRPETLARVLAESYEQAVGELAGQQGIPKPASFRKSLTTSARTVLHRAVEQDQKVHLGAVIEAFEAGHSDPWPGPVPSRQAARLTRTVLEGIDQVHGTAERILLRALMTGTHACSQLARLLDLPDLAPTLSRALCLLSDTLQGMTLPGLPGYLQSLKQEPCAPPSALLAADAAKGGDADRKRAAALSVLAGLSAADIAARMGRKPEAVAKLLEDSGLAEGPWHRSGAMLVDLAAFTRELEVRDLAAYVHNLCGDRERMDQNWKLMNRDAKVLAFWLRNLLSSVNGSTYGHGLTGPWLRARLASSRHAVGDLHKWLTDGGLKAADLGRCASSKLHPKLSGLCAPKAQPDGPDLSRPLASLPAPRRTDDQHEKQLLKSLLPQVEKLLGRIAGARK